jgi:hypothetical protein
LLCNFVVCTHFLCWSTWAMQLALANKKLANMIRSETKNAHMPGLHCSCLSYLGHENKPDWFLEPHGSELTCSRCFSWGSWPSHAETSKGLSNHLAYHPTHVENKHLLLNATKDFWFVTHYYSGSRYYTCDSTVILFISQYMMGTWSQTESMKPSLCLPPT